MPKVALFDTTSLDMYYNVLRKFKLTAAKIGNYVLGAVDSLRTRRKGQWLRDGRLNSTFPTLFRRVTSRCVRLDKCCHIGCCQRARSKHDIIVLEIRVHNFAAVHVRKTPQSVQQNTLGLRRWKTMFTSRFGLEGFYVSTHNICDEA